jgi:hypothetical protein
MEATVAETLLGAFTVICIFLVLGFWVGLAKSISFDSDRAMRHARSRESFVCRGYSWDCACTNNGHGFYSKEYVYAQKWSLGLFEPHKCSTGKGFKAIKAEGHLLYNEEVDEWFSFRENMFHLITKVSFIFRYFRYEEFEKGFKEITEKAMGEGFELENYLSYKMIMSNHGNFLRTWLSKKPAFENTPFLDLPGELSLETFLIKYYLVEKELARVESDEGLYECKK